MEKRMNTKGATPAARPPARSRRPQKFPGNWKKDPVGYQRWLDRTGGGMV